MEILFESKMKRMKIKNIMRVYNVSEEDAHILRRGHNIIRPDAVSVADNELNYNYEADKEILN
jgi:hypothetical protein